MKPAGGAWYVIACLVGFVCPFGNIIGPLVVWLLKRDTSPFVDDQGKEALNFQLSLTIYSLVAALLVIVLVGLLLLPALLIAAVVLTIVAAIKANDGVAYRYPYIFRLL
ncbi:MAG: DUF4870 domain-containing protein [Candidatus Hydrogenedens sp.]|nr:DUF4870 domain-containing protein [Candidatus Hydrogenedens sp.]